MKPERLEELLWRRFDGCIDPADRKALDTWLAADPSARRLEAEIQTLVRGLASLPPVIPPAVLRKRIDRALSTCRAPGGRRTPQEGHRPVRSRLQSWLLPLAAGLVLGAVVVQLLSVGQGSTPEPKWLGGLMQTAPSDRNGDGLAIDLVGLQGSLHALRRGPSVSVTIDLWASVEVELIAEQSDALVSVRGLRSDLGRVTDVRTDAGRCTVHLHAPAAAVLILEVTGPPKPLLLELRSNGEVLGRGLLAVDGSGGVR